MTRQPAEENRIAVAWPIPRLAPVKSRVRRGALDEEGMQVSRFPSCPASCRASTSCLVILLHRRKSWMAGTSYTKTCFALMPGHDDHSGIEPHLRPRAVRRVAAEFDAVVQAERTVVPKFETRGVNAPAAPPLRTRHFADHVFGGDQRDRLLEGKPALQRLRLLAGP